MIGIIPTTLLTSMIGLSGLTINMPAPMAGQEMLFQSLEQSPNDQLTSRKKKKSRHSRHHNRAGHHH